MDRHHHAMSVAVDVHGGRAGLRVAVNTAVLVVGDDENGVMGDPTKVPSRLQQEARDGAVGALRRGVPLRGDREVFPTGARVVSSYETQIAQTLLATAGDRLTLRRLHFSGNLDGGAVETEALSLMEVYADGRIVALVASGPAGRQNRTGRDARALRPR